MECYTNTKMKKLQLCAVTEIHVLNKRQKKMNWHETVDVGFHLYKYKPENLICAVRDPEGGHLRESRGNDQNGAGGGGGGAWWGLFWFLIWVQVTWTSLAGENSLRRTLRRCALPYEYDSSVRSHPRNQSWETVSPPSPSIPQATTAESWAKCRTGQTQPARSAYYHNYVSRNVQSPHFPFMSIMLWGHGLQLQPWNMQLSEHNCIHFREPGWGRSTHTAWPMQSAPQPPPASSHPAMKLLDTLGCLSEQRQQLWGQIFWDRIPNLKIAWKKHRARF